VYKKTDLLAVFTKICRPLFLHSLRSLSKFLILEKNTGLHNFLKKNNTYATCTRKQIYWSCLQKFVGLYFCIRCEIYPGFILAQRNRGLHNCVKKNNKAVVCTRKQIYWLFLQKLWASVLAFAAKSIQVFFFGKNSLL